MIVCASTVTSGGGGTVYRACFRLRAAVPLGRRKFTVECSAAAEKKKEKQKVIVISGPTGAGKSKLALDLAKRLNGEIISADSVQVYQGLDIGSAKPPLSDRQEVPHHLIDILHPSEDYSVGKFYDDAREATRSILDKGRVPIVTGGTGLYLRWYVYGKPDVPQASQEVSAEVHAELNSLQKSEDWETAVQLVVKAGDPKAELLPAFNWYRLRRSLEILKSSGSPPSAFEVPYDSFRKQPVSEEADGSPKINPSADLGLDIKSRELDYEFYCFFLSSQRLDLYKSLDYRCEEMLLGSDGLLSEANHLLDLGLLPNSNSASRAIGYRQAMEYLLMCRSLGDASSTGAFYSFISNFQKASRNFAKRQLTWFRNEEIYHWIDASKPLEKVLDFIYEAYHGKSENVVVPDLLKMRKETSHREGAALKAYRTRNRHFVKREDCSEILQWVTRTQCEKLSEV